jgi:hypothetical protein
MRGEMRTSLKPYRFAFAAFVEMKSREIIPAGLQLDSYLGAEQSWRTNNDRLPNRWPIVR